MICMILVFVHLLCIAFGFDSFVKNVEVLLWAGILEMLLIDLPTSLFIGIKKGWFK